MRRRIALVAAWAAVTAAATAVAWQAVAVVGDNVSPRAAAPVALDELAGAGPGTTVGTTEPAGGATSPAPPASGTPASTDPAAPGRTTRPAPVPTTAPAVPVGTPGPPTTAAPAPAPTAPGPSPTTAPAAATETRTAASTGGTISVRFAAGTVELLWASPEPGFTTEIVRQDRDRVEVEFVGDGHTSRIRARWVGAAPDVEVTESGG